MTFAGYQIDLIEAGRLRLDGGAMFGIVPRSLWERRIQPDERNRIPLAMRCLLLRGHGRTILVDTGVGKKSDAKFEDIYGVDHEHSTLLGSLAALEVAPEDITDVLFTHLHFDHAGGATRRTDAGDLKVVFPHADLWVGESHWAWAHESPRESASFLSENLDPLESSGRLRLLGLEDEPFPYIALEVVDGHTKGQVLPRVTDGRQSIFYPADLIPTAAHVSPLWIMAYDIEPLSTLEEKQTILSRAVREEWAIIFEHDPVTAWARLVETDRGVATSGERPDLPSEM